MEILDRINGKKWFIDDVATRSNSDRARELLLDLKGTQFMNIGEFGRTVHAEMAALLDAARRGVSINKQAMFVTTFPCHNCAKHIVAAGIEKVVYLEPYPKSRAGFLHREEVEIDPEQGVSYGDKLVFWRFSGVAPRQYNVLFRMTERGGKGDLLAKWYANRAALKPLYVVRNAASAYLVAEREELENLPSTEFSWDRNKLASAR